MCEHIYLKWTTTFKLLGIFFDVDLTNIPKINYDKKLVKIKNIINHWKKRHTTPLGRISIIKSLLISQLNHLFISLPMPSINHLKNLIKEILFHFLWNSKVDRIKRKQITQNYEKGGLKMIDIDNYIKGLKCSWIKRLMNGNNPKWKQLLGYQTNIDKILFQGSAYRSVLLRDIRNPFWRDTLNAYQTLHNKIEIETWNEFINQPIWFNTRVKIDNKTIFYEHWYKRNINYISDIINEEGAFYSLFEIQSKYKIKTNFLVYASLKSSIMSAINKMQVNPEKNNIKPHIPTHLRPFFISKKGTKPIYNILCLEHTIPFGQLKWGTKFAITEDQWEKLYELPFKCTKSSKLLWLQYRINQYILTTNVTLFKYGNIDTKLCSFCTLEDETILHILWSCPKVQDLLSSFKNHCENNDLHFTMDGGSFILGHMLQLPNEHNFVFMCIKLYIYRKRCLKETLQLQGLLSDIKTQLITLKYIYTKKGQINNYTQRWRKWLFLIR